MPKQHYRYSYDAIDIFQILSNYYASSNINNCPWEISQSSPASPRKTPSIPPLLLGLTQS